MACDVQYIYQLNTFQIAKFMHRYHNNLLPFSAYTFVGAIVVASDDVLFFSFCFCLLLLLLLLFAVCLYFFFFFFSLFPFC